MLPVQQGHPLPHEIVTVVGTTGSGKTALIAQVIGPRHRRRITLDTVGECARLYPRATPAHGLVQLLQLLRAFHEHDAFAWHIVASLSVKETGELLRLLAPTGPTAGHSLAAAWGGLALEIFELDIIAPVDRSERQTSEAIRNAYARGRHYGLSMIAATQRPHQIDRNVTAQSTHVVTFQMHEPADLKWLERVGGRRFAQLARGGLPRFGSAWYHTRSGELYTLDPGYRAFTAVPREGAA